MALNESNPGLAEYVTLFRRRRVWILTIVPAALLIAMYLAYAIPSLYQSTSTIILEQSSIPQELVKTTVASYANQQIDIISGRVLSVESLRELVSAYNPYPNEPNLTLDQRAAKVLANTSVQRVDPVTLEPRLESSALSIHYQNPSPRRAAEVARRLGDLFLTYQQRERTMSAKSTAKLLAERAADITAQLGKLDDEYAQLRIRHGDALPDAKDRNEAGRDRAERELDELQSRLRTAQEKESLLSIQLNGISPNLMSNSKGDLTDLATVRAQLADAEQRYTPDHPDVKRLRRALASLVAEQNARGDGGGIKADNPEYRRVASQLDSARKEVNALQSGVSRSLAQQAQYAAYLRSSPEIEREYNDLQRRRQGLQTQYQEIQDKLHSAQMGQVMESERQGERFSLIGEPVIASSPSYPNRLGLIALGLVLGCVIAAIAVAVAESSDVTVRGSRDLAGLGQVNLLGGVPEILRSQDIRRKRLVWGSVALVYLVAAFLVAFTMAEATARTRAADSTLPSS
jgi:uncharacterized protein involved in exopolysaccharide biosynthesis